MLGERILKAGNLTDTHVPYKAEAKIPLFPSCNQCNTEINTGSDFKVAFRRNLGKSAHCRHG
jgi:hypothetical protein